MYGVAECANVTAPTRPPIEYVADLMERRRLLIDELKVIDSQLTEIEAMLKQWRNQQ